MSTPTVPAEILEVQMEIRISGTVSAVWKALTDDIGVWWPEEFFAGGEPQRRRYHLEPTPGGRMYEAWDDGGGLLWATVVTVDPGKLLQIFGTTFPNWGGPSLVFGTWALEADGSEVVLSFTESTVGRVADSLASEKRKGWEFLLGGALKSHVEGRPAPEWQD
jgi:uncharacterized protein YndB with AHSA1/START domain